MKIYIDIDVDYFEFQDMDLFIKDDVLRLCPSDNDSQEIMPYPWFYMDDIIELRVIYV